MNWETDRKFMNQCIALAEKALEKGDAPFGSLIARGETLIAEGVNSKESRISDHAEILALHNAHLSLGSANLEGCTLYTSCEPCPMCSFMAREYKISRVVYALRSRNMGGHSKWRILDDDSLNRLGQIFGPPPEIIGGFMEKEAMDVMGSTPLIEYFREMEGEN